MMIAGARSKLLLEATFPSLSLARPVLDKLAQCSRVTLTILRGRLTRDEARFEFEVTGGSGEVDDVVRIVRQWGCAVRTRNAVS